MAITAEEMNNLRDMVEDVITRRVDPRFEQIDSRLDGIDVRLEHIEDDVAVIKDVVKDHSFEIARLKHRTA